MTDMLYSIKALGSGKPHDPEKKRLQEIIDTLNDLFGAEVSDDDKLQYAEGIANRIRRDEEVMVQVNKHSEKEVMHGLLPQRLMNQVVASMEDHEKLSLEILESPEVQNRFALLILKMLVGEQSVKRVAGSE